MMMLFMVGWNKHFNIIDTLLQTEYIYTYKNADQKTSNYQIEGYMLLVVFVVKFLRLLINIVSESKKKMSEKEKREKQIKKDFKVMENENEEESENTESS